MNVRYDGDLAKMYMRNKKVLKWEAYKIKY